MIRTSLARHYLSRLIGFLGQPFVIGFAAQSAQTRAIALRGLSYKLPMNTLDKEASGSYTKNVFQIEL